MGKMAEFEDMNIQRMKLADLKPAEYNPRKMRDEARQGLGSSIGEFGMLVPIIWNEQSGNIVGGHQRYEHLLAIGETETDVVVVNLDHDREVALNIALNNKAIRGDFTKEVVDLLRLSEAQIGTMFKELGLLDLHNYVRRLKFDDDKSPKDKGTGDGTGDGGGEDDPPLTDSPNAVICCPRCQSKWRMSDNKVVYNAIAAGAAKPSGEEEGDERE
jgi:hypothetical protein